MPKANHTAKIKEEAQEQQEETMKTKGKENDRKMEKQYLYKGRK